MKKHIAEELPARKHAPAAAPAPQAKGGEDKEGGGKKEQSSEKKIRQAVYDIRYRARREDIDLKQAFSQYMSNSSLSPQERAAVRAKLFGKEGGAKVAEQFENTGSDLAVDGVANALFKVFVEGIEQPEEPVQLVYERQMESKSGTKYHVSVTDPKTGRKYTRFATREKITQLRAKGLKVDMTEHEDTRERAASAKKSKGKKLDPVAKKPGDRDGDVNNDGKKDKTDSYIYNRRDAINKAIAKEDYVWTEATGTTSTEGQNSRKIDVMKSGEQNAVKVFPDMKESKSHQKFSELIQEKKLSKKEKEKKEKYVKGMKKSKKDFEERYGEDGESVMHATATKMAKGDVKEEAVCPKCGKCPCECDRRDKMAYRNLLKNKIRAMGIKNPMMLDMPEDEKIMKIMTSSSAKQVDEGMGLVTGASKVINTVLKPVGQTPEQGKKAVRDLTRAIDTVAKPVKSAVKSAASLGGRAITAGGGTPDTQSMDAETRRLGTNRVRQALQKNPNLFK